MQYLYTELYSTSRIKIAEKLFIKCLKVHFWYLRDCRAFWVRWSLRGPYVVFRFRQGPSLWHTAWWVVVVISDLKSSPILQYYKMSYSQFVFEQSYLISIPCFLSYILVECMFFITILLWFQFNLINWCGDMCIKTQGNDSATFS